MLRLSSKQIGIHKSVATKIKDILDFTEEQKYVSIEALVKSFHKQSDAQQKIKDALNGFGIEVIVIDDDAAPVDVIRNYMQDRRKQDRDVLAYVRLYIDDREQNTSWLKYDFPCPVVFDFYKTKAKDQTPNDSAIVKACNEEFSLHAATVHQRILKINSYLECYSSYLRELIRVCSNKGDIHRCIVESFDENSTEDKLFSFARSVRLDGNPNTQRKISSIFTVKEHKESLVRAILNNLCEKINYSILTELSKHIKDEINTKVFDAVRAEVGSNQVGTLASHNIFIWIWELLSDGIRTAILVVGTFFKPPDINSYSWREEIATVTHKSLLKHRIDILEKLDKQYRVIYAGITYHLKRELQETSDHRLLPYSAKGRSGMTDSWSYHHESEQPGITDHLKRELQKTSDHHLLPYSAKGRSVFVGCKLTAATYGTDEFGRKVIGLRADNFDHIHLSYEKGMDIFFDKKTIKESTSELQQVDTYLDFQPETVKIEITLRGHLKQIIRKHTPDLIKTHSNLITISTSPVMSHRDGIEKAPCIVIYCSCKGIIPLGEHKFPRTLDKIPVDVREGYVYFATAREFHDPLRQGCSIGVSGDSKAGSIGVFVKEIDTADQYGLLTCAHVLLPSTELNKPGIRQKIRDSIVTVDVVQPSYLDNNSNIRCGRLIDANFGNVSYQNKFTGVDYAYVKMTSRIPRVLKFPSVEWQHTEASLRDGYTEEAEMGPPILDMDENDTEHCVCKFGRTTGHTRGVFNFNGAVLRKEPFSASLGQQANEECCLYNLYNIESLRRPFFEQGDSGASVFIKKHFDDKTKVHVIGLALGGLCNGRECFVTPIGAVLDSIDPRIEIQCFPY